MDKKKFGQFIKETRQAKAMTQAELAERLYVDVTAVSKWERGVSFPDISLLSDICKCLDVTEHELIESSKDTAYRQLAYQAKQYKKTKKIVFWSFTSCFLVAVFLCFLIEACVAATLSWSLIVLTGCLCGYWAFFFPVLFPLLKRVMPEKAGGLLSRGAMLIYFVGLLLFTLAILATVNAYTPISLRFAVQTTVYCFTIGIFYGCVAFLPIDKRIKGGIDSIATGLYFLSMAKVLPALMKVEEIDYFDVDFADWAGHTNGNVAMIILFSFALLGGVMIAAGIKRGAREKAK